MGEVRGLVRSLIVVVVLLVLAAGGRDASALEALDGRVQLHGFYEMQTRVMSRNFRGTDDWDLTQWYHVLNLEFEFDIAPDGWGPFSLISAYARVEGRFDCVWDRACHVFPAANTYGDRSRKLPKRLSDGRRDGYTDSQFTGDVRKRHGVSREFGGYAFGVPPFGPTPSGRRTPAHLFNVPGLDTLFGQKGPDQILDTADDPAPFALSEFVDYRFAMRKIRGSSETVGTQILGPWLPKNFVDPIGSLSDKPNPFNPLDFSPVSGGVGVGALPYRPSPTIAAGGSPDQFFAQGIYYPNEGVARAIRHGRFNAFDQNFREAELKWNRGASQQQTRELKEAYIDVELLDSALWIRAGKQSIVWGKTELFRTTDQFNPQDMALSSLPSLEESRISLWSIRAVYSLWQVGPLEDVRIELAANIDHFEPLDIGQCGEPYTANVACNKRAGLFAHGIFGYGLAGETRPPDPWEDIRGLEGGIRVEFRWNRFSVAITDFYGYDDSPHVDQLFRYSRNVDPFTGRPREGESQGRCVTGAEPACLTSGEALTKHHANQQGFAFICSTSIAFAASLDPGACAQSIFTSDISPLTGLPNPGFNVATVIGNVLSGDFAGLTVGDLVLTTLAGPSLTAGVDPADLPFVDLTPLAAPGDMDLSLILSTEQQALLGCGAYYGTSCHDGFGGGGIDLLNAEASALTMAWITQPSMGSTTATAFDGNLPGTTTNPADRFSCQRWVAGVGMVVLPGCRAPGESGPGWAYSAAVDGDPGPLAYTAWLGGGIDASILGACQNPADPGFGLGFCRSGHPISGDPFRSVMDAFSWNYQMLLVIFTIIGADDNLDGDVTQAELNIDQFDPTNPLATDRCSWVTPQFCRNIQALQSIIGRRRNSVLAGGSSRYGRADFYWHGGSSSRIKYKKRNVLGFSLDFAEDVTKSNWSLETTWIHNKLMADNDALDGLKEVDEFNLTVSVDRPTFINFLNQSRTFFINSQWFFRYIEGYGKSMPSNGPFNVLMTLTVSTGFYQDRLQPSITNVYDFMSESGAVAPSVSYRFSESFSVQFGMMFFYGKWQSTRMPLSPTNLSEQTGSGAYRVFSERGLGVIRDRDEVFLRLRKTF